MGNTLVAAAQWTSAKVGGRGKLESTPVNDMILNRISEFVPHISSNSPKEAAFTFREPLSWKTKIDPGFFTDGYKQMNDSTIQSNKTNDQGRPHLILQRMKTGDYELRVSTFEALDTVLIIADKHKMEEIRACLEANPDPFASILGAQFTNVGGSGYDDTVAHFIDLAYPTSGDGSTEDDHDPEVEEKKVFVRLLLKLKEFDERLMTDAVRMMSSDVRIHPADVDKAVELLRAMSSRKKSARVLEYIRWMSPYTFVFDNGCRAPMWRQLHGDISYIEVKPIDGDVVYITACTSGYYVNKRQVALKSDDKDFERKGELHRNLIHLLRGISKAFSASFDSQNKFDTVEANSEYPARLAEEEEHEADADEEEQEAEAADKEEGSVQSDYERDAELERKKKKKKKGRKKPQRVLPVHVKHVELECKTKKKKKLQKSKLEIWLDESSTENDEGMEDQNTDGPFEKSKYHFIPTSQDLHSEHWFIQKMFRYIRGGHHTATIVALCSVLDLNLTQESIAQSIREAGGLEVLINLLEVDDVDCQTASLKIIKAISHCRAVRQNIVNLGGIECMIKLLHDLNDDVRCLAAECIGHCAKTGEARKIIRQQKGIPKLVGFLDAHVTWSEFVHDKGAKFYPNLPVEQLAKLRTGDIHTYLAEKWKNGIRVAKCGAIALSDFANSKRNRKIMQLSGALPFLARLIKSTETDLLIPTVAIVGEFAKESLYGSSILSEGMIPDLVRCLKSDNLTLVQSTATALFKACEDSRIRHVVRQSGGLKPIVFLLGETLSPESLIQVTGATWKLSMTRENVDEFQRLEVIPALIPYLKNQKEKAIIHTAAAFSEILKVPANRIEFHKHGGLAALLALQIRTNPHLLTHVNYALAQCAEEKELIGTIVDRDGVRLLWSLLKNPHDDVKASAAWALCPCVRNAADSAYMVRSFVCGVEMLVGLLKSDNKDVLAAACAAIGSVAKDEENLGVLTEYGVVLLLSKLICTNYEKLKATLAEAIAMCCGYGDNRTAFGKEDVVVPLVKYLKCNNPDIHRSTARALYEMSLNPDNCIKMHAMGCVPLLLKLVGSTDFVLQEAASKCIANIRKMFLANQIARDHSTQYIP